MGNSKTKPEQTNCKETNDNDTSLPQLQIRNCIQNVRNNNNSLTDLYPDLSEAGATCGMYSHSVKQKVIYANVK